MGGPAFQFTLLPFATALIQLLDDFEIKILEKEPDEIRLGFRQTRARDTGALHSNRELGSLSPRVLIVSAELANFVVGVLEVNADTEDVSMLETDGGELRVRGSLEFPREVAVIPFPSSATAIATLYKVK